MSSESGSQKVTFFKRVTDAFENLKKREQTMLMVLAPSTIIAVVVLVLIEPQLTEASKFNKRIGTLEQQIELTDLSTQELFEQANIDPNVALRQQIASLEKQLNELNERFEGEMSQLVSPQAMPGLLNELFSEAGDLEVLSMKSLSPTLVDLNKQSESDSNDAPEEPSEQQSIYRHGIEITFEGNFFATRDFLDSAENLSWKLYWQDLTYSVSEHPKAVTQLTVFTLSTSEAFIGVN